MLWFILFVVAIIIIWNLLKEPKSTTPPEIQQHSDSYSAPVYQSLNKTPQKKDNSKFLPDYTVVDVETTGFNYRTDRIIQFGAVKVRNHQIVDTLSFLVNPGIPIPDEASKVNGITNEMVEGLPSFTEHIDEVLTFIGSDTLLAHNAPFDKGFIEYQLGETLPNRWLDTLSYAKEYYPYSLNYKLGTLYKDLVQKEPENAHDALADCKMAAKVFEAITEYAGDNGKLVHWQMIDNPVLYCYELPKREFVSSCAVSSDMPFYKKHVVFTGVIPGIVRRQAIQAVINQGGDYGYQLRQKTSFLVTGEGANEEMIKQAETGVLPDKPVTILSAEEFKRLIRP